MARVHADSHIRKSHVTEVCRLLKASNIAIKKVDLEFQDNQDELNRENRERLNAEMEEE